jgi:adenosylhomocysteine nucleosidase
VNGGPREASDTTQYRAMKLREQKGGEGNAPSGVVCALPAELGDLRHRILATRVCHGLEVHEIDAGDHRLLACVCGIGKVLAARAATILLAEGARRLLVVGTCGGLRRHLRPGTLVHCRRAIQTDFASREGRQVDATPEILSAWQSSAPGREGLFLTADRPVLSIWRRFRLVRALAGDCVAEMETAAVGVIAEAAGVPWGALRAVTDRAGTLAPATFRVHYPVQAGRAADTIPGLLGVLGKELPPREGLSEIPTQR